MSASLYYMQEGEVKRSIIKKITRLSFLLLWISIVPVEGLGVKTKHVSSYDPPYKIGLYTGFNLTSHMFEDETEKYTMHGVSGHLNFFSAILLNPYLDFEIGLGYINKRVIRSCLQFT